MGAITANTVHEIYSLLDKDQKAVFAQMVQATSTSNHHATTNGVGHRTNFRNFTPPPTTLDHFHNEHVRLERLQKGLLRKKALTVSEIVKGQLWGNIQRVQVNNIIKQKVDDMQKIMVSGKYKIMRGEVRRIAIERGELWTYH
ncbi:hypothetical protein ACFQ1M_09850 [Sungkyunkwania multivorans]|uniref:Uncharacterized protein n=1 Tax=Sungkyunkwania multivorans TaxID=1173618 RepID=A0ABW3CY92_9FLAO